MDLRNTLSVELEFEREIARSPELSLFRRNPTTWELLLLLSQAEGASNEGVYNTIESVQTRYLGDSALLKFIRERRDDGLVRFLEHEKKSKRTVQLHNDLIAQMTSVLNYRNSQLLRAESNRPTGHDGHVSDNDVFRAAIDRHKDHRE